jgi:predicted O-methyltransferase YrrM
MIFAWDVGSSVTPDECALLAWLAKDRDVLEVGSWLGRSTIALASTARHVTAIDWHHGDFYAGEMDTEAEFRQNLARYEVADRVQVVVARVEEVPIQNGIFGGVFIDAAHDADSVRAHWQIAVDAANESGWIAFHDYGRFDVTEVLDELMPDGPCSLAGTIAVYRRRDVATP